jgi:dihydroxyacetone kinase
MVTKWIVVFAVIMSAGLASPAARADKEDVKGIAIDVLTGIAEQAQEAQEAKKDNRCEKLEAMCDDGKDWACSKAEKECN